MSHKNLALGILAVLVSFLVLNTFSATFYNTLQAIDPVAALSALTVAVVGITWFKKTNR